MIQGDTRQSSGRETGFGRRLRVGALGTIAIGGAIVMGGAATLVTAFANTGGVAAAQDCTTWSASASLDDNVNNRLVTVTTTIAGLTGYSNVISTDGTNGSTKAPVTIWTHSGSAPKSGSVTETIYSDTTNAKVDQTYTATLPAPSNCTSAINTTPSAGGVVGTSIHDAATVTGTTGSPAGTVIFALFPPSNATCSAAGTPAVLTSAPISLTSVSPGVSNASSPAFVTTAVGVYHWVATYSGSSIYKSAKSNCADEAATISQAGPAINTTPSGGGQVPIDVHDVANVTGGVSPTGTVTFTLYPSVADCTAGTNALGTSTVPLSSGSATSDAVHVTAAGTDQAWLATYNGDANNAKASSGCSDELITTTTGGGGVQGITTPSTGGNGSLNGLTIGGFLLLGGLGLALMGSILPRRRRTQ
jgi:hypothetical protein